MILPSKELISEVLSKEVEEERFIYSNSLTYVNSGIYEDINIYELVHKCKEWARGNYYVNIMTYKKGAKYYVLENEFLNDENFEADTEHETIFKACDYILKELSNK